MKKIYPISAMCALLALGGITYASSRGSHSLKTEKQLTVNPTSESRHDAMHRAPRKAASAGNPYWCSVISQFDADGQFAYNGGIPREFGTHVQIDGEDATIYGLIDLYYDEVDAEYPVKGKYDSRHNTITVTGTAYDDEASIDSFIKIADMYSEENGGEYSLVLFAGDFDDWGNVETKSELVFKVNDDLTTITASIGYGAYAFSTAYGDGMGFYDYYKTSVMEAAKPGVDVAASSPELSYSGLFMCVGTPQKDTFNLVNKGIDEASFSISTTCEDLVLTPSSGKIGACESIAVTATLTPSHAGAYDDEVTINVEGMDAPIVVKLNVEAQERPDYMKIVKADSEPISFQMSPVYPFVESEYDGHIAFESTNEGKGDNTQSWFACNVEVPAGKVGLFSWKAVQMSQQPNCLLVTLDGEWYKYDMYATNTNPLDCSDMMMLPEGKYEIGFINMISLDWSKYDIIARSFVWDLDLTYIEAVPDNVYCPTTEFTFDSTFFDKLSVEIGGSVTIYNSGLNPLKVLGVTGSGNFSGSKTNASVPTGGQIEVPLIWAASALGEETGTITISTTGGDVVINCSGTATPLPADYSPIVGNGDFSFNTSTEYPFVMAPGNKYAYNSSSKADINGLTYSWLEASFQVEEGTVALLNWDATNESEDIFYFMGSPSLISGTIISIDGANDVWIGGDADCSSSNYLDPSLLVFRPGRHNVRFTYKKTSNDESYVFGEDRTKVFELGLDNHSSDDFRGMLSAGTVSFPKNVYCGCIGHLPLTLYNYSGRTPEITGVECDGPFSIVNNGVKNGNLNMTLEFTPVKGGDYDNVLTLHTNIGDYMVTCKGTADESSIGYAIFYESFEYDFENNWVMKDLNSDGNTWMPVAPNMDVYYNSGASTADGTNGLMITGYDPTTYQYYEMDDCAVTPEIAIPAAGNTRLRFMSSSYTYSPQTLEILVGEGDDVASFTTVETIDIDYMKEWTAYIVDLTAFAGKTVRIAFRAISEYGMLLNLDDVLVANDEVGAVGALSAEKMIVAREYYSTDGRRMSAPSAGVAIEVARFSDGSSLTRKINVR